MKAASRRDLVRDEITRAETSGEKYFDSNFYTGFIQRYDEFVRQLPTRDYPPNLGTQHSPRQAFCKEVLRDEVPVPVCGKRGDLVK